MVVFLLSVLLHGLQVILAEWFLLHQEVEHVGGVEGLLTEGIRRQVQGENILQIVVISLWTRESVTRRQGENIGLVWVNSLSEGSVPLP